MKNRVRPWVRMFAAEADAAEAASAGQGTIPSQHAPQELADAEGREGGVDRPAESAPCSRISHQGETSARPREPLATIFRDGVTRSTGKSLRCCL